MGRTTLSLRSPLGFSGTDRIVPIVQPARSLVLFRFSQELMNDQDKGNDDAGGNREDNEQRCADHGHSVI